MKKLFLRFSAALLSVTVVLTSLGLSNLLMAVLADTAPSKYIFYEDFEGETPNFENTDTEQQELTYVADSRNSIKKIAKIQAKKGTDLMKLVGIKDGFAMEKGKQYAVTFRSRADISGLYAGLRLFDGDTYKALNSSDFIISYLKNGTNYNQTNTDWMRMRDDSSWATYTLLITPNVNISNFRLRFFTYGATSVFYLDEISAEVVNTADAADSTFDKAHIYGTDGWTAGSDATVELTGNGYENTNGIRVYKKTAGRAVTDNKISKTFTGLTANTDYVLRFNYMATENTTFAEDANHKNTYKGGYQISGVTETFATVDGEKDSTDIASSADTTNNWMKYYGSTDLRTWRTYEVKFNIGDLTEITISLYQVDDGFYGYYDNIDLIGYQTPVAGEFMNGGFEEGTQNYDIGINLNAEPQTTIKAEGEKAVKLSAKTAKDPNKMANNSISQTFTVEKFKTYKLSFKLKFENPEIGKTNSGVYLVNGNGTRITDVTYKVNGNVNKSEFVPFSDNTWVKIIVAKKEEVYPWKTYELKFTSDENTDFKFAFFQFSDTAIAYLDDITLEETVPDADLVINEFRNGGFEKEIGDEYVIGSNLSINWQGNVKKEGSKALKITAKDPGNTNKMTDNAISQTFAVNKNTNYTISFRVKFDNPQTKNLASSGVYLVTEDGTSRITNALCTIGTSVNNIEFVNISNWYKIAIQNAELKKEFGWNRYNLTFNSGDNSEITFAFFQYSDTTTSYLDDITLRTPPIVSVKNTVSNGGFESGEIDDYYKIGEQLVDAKVQDRVKLRGKYAAEITWNGKGQQMVDNAIEQTIPVDKNTYYEVQFKIKIDKVVTTGATGGIFVKLGESGFEYAKKAKGSSPDGGITGGSNKDWWTISTQDTDWHTYNLIVNSRDYNKIRIGYFQFNKDAKVYIDDISIKIADPEKIAKPNEIHNGTFESEYLDNWNTSGKSEIKRSTEKIHSGKYSLKIIGSGTVSQIIDVEKNTYYTATFHYVAIDAKNKEFTKVIGYLGARDGKNRGISSRLVGTGSNSEINTSDGYNPIGWDNSGEWRVFKLSFYTGNNDQIYVSYNNIAETVAYLDDISIKKEETVPFVSTTSDTVVINNDFEDAHSCAFGTSLGYANVSTITDKEAHSGKYAVEYNPSVVGRHNEFSWKDKYYRTENYNVVLKPNQTYRLSCYVKSNFAINENSLKIAVENLSIHKDISLEYYKTTTEWQKYEYVFTTSSNNNDKYRMKIYGAFDATDTTKKLYIDDIKLEVVGTVLIESNIENTFCESAFNLIDNGNFEKDVSETNWESIKKFISIQNDKENAVAGNCYAILNGNIRYQQVLKLSPGRIYTFAYSVKHKGGNNDFKIGILVNGKPFKKSDDGNITSLNGISHIKDEWSRESFSFVAPTSGNVTFVIQGDANSVYLDEIHLFQSSFGYKNDPNDYSEDAADDLRVLNSQKISADNPEKSSNMLWLYIGIVVVVLCAVIVPTVIIYLKHKRRNVS